MPRNDKKKKIPSPPMPAIIENARTHEVYEVKCLLGKGGFAKVYAVKCRSTKEIMACKAIIRASLVKPQQIQKLKYEIKIHRELKHPNIVRYFVNFQDEERIYILMEYCKNQTLMELVNRRKRLSEPETQYYMLQIIGGVRYLHDTNVIHRDLKLGNILLDADMHCKIADFGLATKLQTPQQRKTTICGTPNYIAPEVLDGKKGGHSFEADIWSMGVIMYTLLLGIPPFQTGRVNTTYKKIKASSYEYPSNISITSYAKGLIDNMLQRYAESRPTILDITNNEFFTYIKPPTSLPVTALRKCPLEYALSYSNAAKVDKKRAREAGDKNPGKKAQSERIAKRTRLNPLVNAMKRGSKGLKSARVGGGKPSNKEAVIIEKWIDYRKKYGVGYCLNNGCVGVWFNDNTRILLHPDKDTVTYMGSTTRKWREEPMDTFRKAKHSPKLKKKITLLEHFNYHLQDKKRALGEKLAEGKVILVVEALKTDECILFVLNNQTVQVNFTDYSELCYDLNSEFITFTDKHKKTRSCFLDNLPEDDTVISRRLRYMQQKMRTMHNH